MQHKMIYNINIKRQGNKRKLGNTDRRSMYKTKQNEIQQKHEFNQKKKKKREDFREEMIK